MGRQVSKLGDQKQLASSKSLCRVAINARVGNGISQFYAKPKARKPGAASSIQPCIHQEIFISSRALSGIDVHTACLMIHIKAI